jgi:nucleoid-associated protein YgaU
VSDDPTSRYYAEAAVTVPAADGTSRVLGAPRVVPAEAVQGTYQIRPGDRLDLMAQVATGDSTKWWVLADANPFVDATRLEQPGQTIELPRA